MRPGNLETYGFNKIVRDLDRAISLARLSGIQSAVVQAAREASWKEASMKGEDARPFKLSPRGLARIFGCTHANLIQAQNDLVNIGVFHRLEDGSCIINKDYRLWRNTGKKDAGQPLFGPEQLAYIMQPKRRTSGRSGIENSTSEQVSGIENSTGVVSKTVPRGIENSTTPVSKTIPLDLGAVIGARASERFKREKEIRDLGVGDAHTHVGTHAHEAIPDPEPPPPLAPVVTFEELLAWFDRVMPNDIEHVVGKLRGWFNTYPVDHIQDAIVCAQARPKETNIAAFVAGCLRNWKEHPERRISPVATPPPPADGQPPPPPPIRLTPSQIRERAENEAIYASLTGKTRKVTL